MRYKILNLVLLALFISCSTENRFIYYSYNNQTVTRWNKEPNDIYLYYGNYRSKKALPRSYIRASFTGFDGLMSGYLIFEPNRVKLLQTEGTFESFGNEKVIELIEFDTVEFIQWNDSITGNYKNIIELSDGLDVEVKRNRLNSSQVNAIYR